MTKEAKPPEGLLLFFSSTGSVGHTLADAKVVAKFVIVVGAFVESFFLQDLAAPFNAGFDALRDPS